ncbi:MAG: hypothetical protein KGL59_11610 [Acidobacteriota bacterium]|nr:hypothetical protein [Acidobacteriota bacterium]
MRKRIGWVAAVCALVLPFAMVQAIAAPKTANVASTWDLSMQGRRGNMTQTLTIQQDGEKIKGTLQGPRGSSNFEGTVKGNAVQFTIKRETPRGEFVMDYSGKVDGDTMKGSARTRRFDIDWSAKRRN